MKAIFLDIDGVLNSRRTPNPRKLPYVIQPDLLARLGRVLEQTGAEVVLSSTWRYDPAGLFTAKRWGIPFVDVIPDLPGRPRRDEILAWLDAHAEVDRFAVIDDEDDELDELPLFQPSPATGLTDDVADRVAAYLDGATDTDMRRGRLDRLLQNVRALVEGHKG
jgi:Swiss Army Knife RNA repair-like protein